MSRQSSRSPFWSVRLVPLLAASCAALLLACEGNVDPKSNCPTNYGAGSDNPKYRFKFIHELPSTCPLFVDAYGTTKQWQAAVYMDVNLAGQYMYTTFSDANGNSHGDLITGVFGYNPNDPSLSRAQPNGSYFFGRVAPGFKSDVLPQDESLSYTTSTDGFSPSGYVFFPYHWPASYHADASPVSFDAGYSTQLSVSQVSYSAAVPPLTYAWYDENGNYFDSGQTVWYGNNTPGVYRLSVTVTDAQGSWQSYPVSLTVTYSGGSTCLQPPCQ